MGIINGMRRLRSWEWRTLPSSFPTAWAHLISQPASLRLFLGDFTPGRWHSPSSTRTWIKPCSCSWMFFPKPKLSPRLPAPAGRALCWGEGAAPTAPGGCGPCLPCQHPQTSQRGAGALQGRAQPCQTTGWGEERCLQEFCSSGTDSIRDWQWQDHTHWELSASHPSGEHKPQCVALHWLGLLLRPFYALNKQNQSPRVKIRLQLLQTASFWNYTSKQY